MRNLIVASIVAAACSKGGVDDAITDLTALKDRMCKCTNSACADEVHADFKATGKKYKHSRDDFKKAPKEKQEQYEKLDTEYRDCRKKARGAADAIAELTRLKDMMCKCLDGDKACADKVNEDWSQATTAPPSAPPSAEDAKLIGQVTQEYTACMTRVSTPK